MSQNCLYGIRLHGNVVSSEEILAFYIAWLSLWAVTNFEFNCERNLTVFAAINAIRIEIIGVLKTLHAREELNW